MTPLLAPGGHREQAPAKKTCGGSNKSSMQRKPGCSLAYSHQQDPHRAAWAAAAAPLLTPGRPRAQAPASMTFRGSHRFCSSSKTVPLTRSCCWMASLCAAAPLFAQPPLTLNTILSLNGSGWQEESRESVEHPPARHLCTAEPRHRPPLTLNTILPLDGSGWQEVGSTAARRYRSPCTA